MLADFDLSQPAAVPIVNKLRSIPGPIRYALDHPLVQCEAFGWTTSTFGTMLAATLWGRSEDAFAFALRDITAFVEYSKEVIYPRSEAGGIMMISPAWSYAMLNLNVSDKHKQILLTIPSFVPSLVDGLLLDPHNPRTTQANWGHVSKIVQRCYAECFHQLALFEPGREALLHHPEVRDSLRAVVSSGWTPESRVFAQGALMALDEGGDRAAGTGGRFAGAGGGSNCQASKEHLMFSYNWDHQAVILRIVAEVKSRGFACWVDVEKMQGSTCDAMAEAVEGAALMLIGISRAYKERSAPTQPCT